jgi:tRNA G10  N-methylase Trm11
MHYYTLHFIPGLSDFVISELNDKFPSRFKIIKLDKQSGTIDIDSDVEFIEEFRILKSCTGIAKNQRRLALDKPIWRKNFVPAGINPSLAWCMCKFAKLDSESIVLDPFCGGGTLGITAGVEFGIKKSILSDISEKATQATIQNLRELKYLQQTGRLENVKTTFNAFVCGIDKLNLKKEKITHITTNPPYGIRVGDHKRNVKIYQSLARLASESLHEHGTIVLISQEKELVKKLFKNFILGGSFDVKSGGLYLRVSKFVKVK